MYLGSWNSCDGVFFKEQKSPPRFASCSRVVSQIRLFQVTYETAYGCPYHPKANVCFVAVMETFPLVKQIFRAERNIWAARMCQNRTDACLLKTQLKKKKSHLVLGCWWYSHSGLSKKSHTADVILIPAPGYISAPISVLVFLFQKMGITILSDFVHD